MTRSPPPSPRAPSHRRYARMIRVLDPGPQTTVQDLGRRGYLRYGIPESGPVDRAAFVLANRLVGNPDDAAGLECTLRGARLEMTGSGTLAATGAEMPLTVNDREAPRWRAVRMRAGDVVRLGPAQSGVRGYLAFAGGVDVPRVLGSRATYLRGQLGGYNGRALRKGDELRCGQGPAPRAEWRGRPARIPRHDPQVGMRGLSRPPGGRRQPGRLAAVRHGPAAMV